MPERDNKRLLETGRGAAIRCRSRQSIRTNWGTVPPAAFGVIVQEMENLGRHMLLVRWDNNICAYVFPHEIEVLDGAPFNLAA